MVSERFDARRHDDHVAVLSAKNRASLRFESTTIFLVLGQIV
ncbi:hypothetical protein KKY_1420 [Pelagibacterium halotolerans B2]|uniref:Uncharacterized protein n=1 Tax=Pelagibacterium halotolerans (strain DSM 22347 / JCM 15775 / CGMCC 1.7692 / B2) TaxID=1082931 RepID=G4R9N4_PELHB|nr:hypothetical protein KKY_1420 [Pelagibacterium halotolerans B2]